MIYFSVMSGFSVSKSGIKRARHLQYAAQHGKIRQDRSRGVSPHCHVVARPPLATANLVKLANPHKTHAQPPPAARIHMGGRAGHIAG